MDLTINRFIFLIVILLSGCISTDIKKEDVQLANLETLFSTVDISILKNVTVVGRGDSNVISKIQVLVNDSLFMLPVIHNDSDTIELMKNFDVVKYAKVFKVDSSRSFIFVSKYSHEIESIFIKCKVVSIQSDERIGDFIEFKINKDYSIVYKFPEGSIYSPLWIAFFNDSTHFINDHWYRGMVGPGFN